MKVIKKYDGYRLDKFLSEKNKKTTRSQLQKLIKQGGVTVNGKSVSVHQFLKTDDVVIVKKVTPKPVEQKVVVPKKIIAPKVIFEDDNIIVLEKPIGMLVHQTDKKEKNTLVDWLTKKDPKILDVGENRHRAGIIHRLDRDVSGIMIAAKTNKAYIDLKKQFKERVVKKIYFAVVYGHMPELTGEINLPIGRGRTGQFVAHPLNGEEKYQDSDRVAKTKYRVVEYVHNYTVVEVEILTGRTHQIRVHMSAINHPILGDNLYKHKKPFLRLLRKKIKIIDPERIFLHSQKIGFNNLEKEWVEFVSPIPKEITAFINERKAK